jgi:hypothetical protein
MWTVIHSISDSSSAIAVVISQSDDKRPRYSIKVCKRRAEETQHGTEEHFLQFIPLFTEGLKIRSVSTVIFNLLCTAERWIEELILNTRIEKDEAQAEHGKPITRKTGKTERERDKKKEGKSK